MRGKVREVVASGPDHPRGAVSTAVDPVAGVTATIARAVGQVRAGLRDPLLRGGYALVANTLATAVLGLAYWIAAARLFSPLEVGRGSAAINLMNLLASVAGLNLAAAMAFLLPQLGRSTMGYVARAYLASTAIALVLVVPLLAVVVTGHHVPGVRDVPRLVLALLVVGVPASAVFTLQDGVLVGLRRAPLVLLENSAFGVAKLLLLPAVAIGGIAGGIFTTWLVPLLAAVVVVNIVVFGRLVPAASHRPDVLALSRDAVRRFVGINYLGSMLYQAYFAVLPLLVLVELGARANGLFYVAWVFASSLDLLAHSMASTMVVEGSADPGRLGALTAQVCKRLAVIVLPIVLVVLVAAPLVLSIYGRAYAEASSGVLRLLVLAAIPRTLVIVVQSAARARGRAHTTLWTEGLTCGCVLGTAAVLLPVLGPFGIGVAWLAANVVVLGAVSGPLVRLLRRPRPAPATATS